MSLQITCRICGKIEEPVAGVVALRDKSHCLCREHYTIENIKLCDIEKKCKYCEGDVDERKALIWVECHYKVHIGKDNHIESGEYPPDGEKFNYCPICGRELV